MISRILLIVFLMASFAEAQSIRPERCSVNILDNGVGYWPWRQAQPFPWSNIQGTWQLAGSQEPVYFVFRIAKASSTRKIIDTRVFEEGTVCSQPTAKGIAYIDANAKTTVRAQISDSQYKYSLKIGKFNTIDLKMDIENCGESILAVSKQVIGSNNVAHFFDNLVRPEEMENFLLKKVSPLLEFACEKKSSKQ